MFEIKNLSKRYGEEFALRDVSMSIGSGLNFIIGASGSGKTSLLKIISAMDQDFEGEAYYCGQSLKTLSAAEKSRCYNSIFGFVWQDFNLLEDLTVLENVLLPQYLNSGADEKAAMKLLRELKISQLAAQKVGKLSGGQKQRVAIARELIKNPRVIIADEPTSALDEKSAKATMDILRDISKSRTVIVVTHDTSLIGSGAKVYELDKGELISASPALEAKPQKAAKPRPHKLSFGSALHLGLGNAKSKPGRFFISALSLLVAATLLLVSLSGAITDSGSSSFDKLFETYGQGILDINVIDSFIGAGDTNGQDSDKPNTDVTQNIEGLYEKYLNDERVSHIAFLQAFNDVSVEVEGKEHKIESSGTAPTLNKLTAGQMPMGDGKEVVVPQSFVKMLGLSEEEALGKTLDFKGAIYNWDSGEPVLVPVKTSAKIVGVCDTNVKYEFEGKVLEYSVDDSFFFSKAALDEMRQQAKTDKLPCDFTIRVKTPADLIAVKDELNAKGIVPLGRFELVEDMVRLNAQTKEQSGSAVIVIGILSLVLALAVSLMTAMTRRREFGIFKLSGYSSAQLAAIGFSEFLLSSLCAGLLFLCASPLISLATTAVWSVKLLSFKMLASGVLLVFATGALSGGVSALVAATTNVGLALKTGDR
ncbi:MAG: ATP-binding cassette domain-containing protein [Oscillospiraceae bacterium]